MDYPKKNTIVLYAAQRKREAISLARDFRRKGKNAELLCKDEEKELEAYLSYGNEYYAGSMVYLSDTGEVEVINLITGEQKNINSTSTE